MGSEYRTPAYGALLAAHDERAELWAAETTATAAGTLPGTLVSLVSALALGCAGEPSLDDGTTVRAQRSGYPDGGATLAYQDADDVWIGWDPPTSVQYVERINWANGAFINGVDRELNAATLPDDRVILVSEDVRNSIVSWVRVRVRDTDGTWSAGGIVYTVPQRGFGSRARPRVIVHDNHVRIVLLQHLDDVAAPFFVTLEADLDSDLTDDASWAVVGQQTTGIDFGTPGHLRIAKGGGQWMATTTVYDSGASLGYIAQYASRDGLSWDHVGYVDLGNLTEVAPALIFSQGAFILVHLRRDGSDYYVESRAVGSAYTPLSSATAVQVFEQASADQAKRHVGFVDDSGVGWVMQLGTETTTEARMWATYTGGRSWRSTGADVGQSGRIWAVRNTPSSDGEAVQDAAPVWWRDRLLVPHRVGQDTVGVTHTLVCLHMGGRASHPLPESSRGWRAVDRWSWLAPWWAALLLPSSWLTVTGAATFAMLDTEPGVAAQIETQVASFYAISPGTGVLSESAGRAVVRVETGTAWHRVKVTDGTDWYEVVVEHTPTGFEVFDNIAGGAALASVTTAAVVDVIVWVSADGSWRVWWREHDDGVRVYEELSGAGLTGATGTDSQWIFSVDESSEVWLFLIGTRDASATDEARNIGRGVATAWEAPNSVHGRPVGVSPVYLAGGLYVTSSAGPARLGDAWTYTADQQYAADHATWTTGLLSSPRRRWRSTVNTAEYLAWKLGDVAVDTISPVWVLMFEGLAQRLSVGWHNGTTWDSSTALDVGLTRKATRYGNTLVLSGTAEVGPFLQEDELAGGFVVDAGGRARRILRNTSGPLGAVTGIPWKVPRIVIESQGDESTGSVDWKIIPPRVCYVFAPPATAKGFRVGFAVSSGYGALPDGVHEAKVLCGPAYLLGKPHGVDTTREYRANRREWVGESGLRLYAESAPPEQVVTLTWQSSLDKLGQARGTFSGGPDYLRGWTGSGSPAYSRGEAESTIRALVERWSAEGRAVAYVPMYDRASIGQALRFQRQNGAMVGTLEPSWLVEHVGPQQEQVSDVVRLGALTIRELT